jgi:hypothetical protein
MPPPGNHCKFMIQILTGVDDVFLPDDGFISIPPDDCRDFSPRSFPAPFMYL